MSRKRPAALTKIYKDMNQPDSAALRASLAAASVELVSIKHELCFNIALADGASLSSADEERLLWLLTETFEPHRTATSSFLPADAGQGQLVEVGPRLTFCTAWSSNAVSICAACGLGQVVRIEPSRRYLLQTTPALDAAALRKHASTLYDRMTECVYAEPLSSFETDVSPQPVKVVPLMTEGRSALERVNAEMGLGFDEYAAASLRPLTSRVGANAQSSPHAFAPHAGTGPTSSTTPTCS